MAAAVTPVKAYYNPDNTQQAFIAYFKIVLSANYGGGSSHGDTLNLSKLGVPSRSVPFRVEIFEAPAAGVSQSGFEFGYNPGTTQANGVLQVFGTPATGSATTPLTEYTQGAAYSGALTGAVLYGQAWFLALN